MFWFVAALAALATGAVFWRDAFASTTRSLVPTRRREGWTEADISIGQVAGCQQETPWTCGPASLRAVLAHHGLKLTEKELADLTGNRPVFGVQSDGIMKAASQLGFFVAGLQLRSVDALRPLLAAGLPVMVVVDSFTRPGRRSHWVVVTGLDARTVQIMDPNTPGNWRTLSKADFDARWWNRQTATDGLVYRTLRTAVVVAPVDMEGIE